VRGLSGGVTTKAYAPHKWAFTEYKRIRLSAIYIYLFKPVTVIIVEEFLNMCDTSRPLSDRDHVKIKKALRGVLIETTHQKIQDNRGYILPSPS
jgi:hypothetical protein